MGLEYKAYLVGATKINIDKVLFKCSVVPALISQGNEPIWISMKLNKTKEVHLI